MTAPTFTRKDGGGAGAPFTPTMDVTSLLRSTMGTAALIEARAGVDPTALSQPVAGPVVAAAPAPVVYPFLTGDVRSLVSVATSAGLLTGANSGTPSLLVSGSTSGISFTAQTLNGSQYFQLAFNRAVVLTNILLRQVVTVASHGTWKVVGSNDGTTWTDIGTSVALADAGGTSWTLAATGNAGGRLSFSSAGLTANTTAYKYYQMVGVSGSTTTGITLTGIFFQLGV